MRAAFPPAGLVVALRGKNQTGGISYQSILKFKQCHWTKALNVKGLRAQQIFFIETLTESSIMDFMPPVFYFVFYFFKFLRFLPFSAKPAAKILLSLVKLSCEWIGFTKPAVKVLLPFLLKKSFTLLVLSLLVSCSGDETSNDEEGDIANLITEEDMENDRERGEGGLRSRREGRSGFRSGRSSSCQSSRSSSEEISIRELDFVESRNIGKYLLQGRCTGKKMPIYLTANGYETDKRLRCSSGRWKITMDLSPIAPDTEHITFELEHNGGKLCRQVRVAFTAPKNYVSIPPHEDHAEAAFYVMKYEAKIDDSSTSSIPKAVSVPDGKPVVGVSYEEALDLCENNGSRYDLINNKQWQNIVLAIEEVDENWSQGRALPSDENRLNCGIYRRSIQPASTNDEDDCGEKECESGWDENRRTHILPNGYKIWDICGNVGEIVKDRFWLKQSFDGYIHKLPAKLKRIFGPKKSYHLVGARQRDNMWNLGYAKIKKNQDLIIRGAPGRDAGIFSVDITSKRDNARTRGQIGFRCIYRP